MNTFVLMGIVLVVGIIIFWTVMILFVKKKDVLIEIQEQGKNKIIRTSGKFLFEGIPKTQKIQLNNKSKEIIPYWFEYFEDIEKEKIPRLRLFKDINGQYHPKNSFYNDNNDTIEEKIDEKDMKFWHTLETREGDEKYKERKKFWEQASPVIMAIVAGMIFFFALYYASDMGSKAMNTVHDYEMRTLDLRIEETKVLNTTTNLLKELQPILKDLSKRNNGQLVGVVNG